MEKIRNLLKQKKFLYYGIGALILIVAGIFLFGGNGNDTQTLVVNRGEFINQVSVSGKVVAAQEVELAFEESGAVERIYAKVGDMVNTGALIAKIDAKDAEKDLHDAEVALSSAKLALDKLKLENSEENLNADLEKAYDDGFSAVSDAFVDLSSTIVGLEDVLGNDLISDTAARASGTTAQNYRSEAEKSYYKALNAFKENRKTFRLLDRTSSHDQIRLIIDQTYNTTKIFVDAVKSAKNLVDYLADDTDDNASYAELKSTLAEYTDTINGHLADLAQAKNDIKEYQDAFGSTNIDSKDLELDVRQKENAVVDAKKKLADYYIRAPFSGLVTKIDAKLGEIASPSTPLVGMISAGTFQIESYVPEVNIAVIEVGHTARVTLDAYGENIVFDASVVAIDPAETIRDGVSTYKVTLQFNNNDPRIKSGMTANVSIIVFSKAGVIVVPGGVVFDREGKKFVQVKKEKSLEDREVVLGDVSSLGQVEVISGLSEGEEIFLNPEVK